MSVDTECDDGVAKKIDKRTERIFAILSKAIDKKNLPVIAKAIGMVESLPSSSITSEDKQLLIKKGRKLLSNQHMRKSIMVRSKPEERTNELVKLSEYVSTRNVTYTLLSDCLDKCRRYKQDEIYHEGQMLLLTMMSEERRSTLQTCEFYLKQGIESRNQSVIDEALQKLKDLQERVYFQHRKLPQHILLLIEEAKDSTKKKHVENLEMVMHYLTQGTKIKSRDMLKQAIRSSESLTNEQQTEIEPLIKQATSLLESLDQQEMMKSFLKSAIDLKDEDGLETAIQHAKESGLSVADCNELKSAITTLENIIQKKSCKTSNWLFRGKKTQAAAVEEKKKYFGVELSKVECITIKNKRVPVLVYDTIEYLKEHGMEIPGIFRVPGNFESMDNIKNHYEQGKEVKLTDANDTSGVLKQYLRELPDPLIPFAYYDAAMKHAKLATKKLISKDQLQVHLRGIVDGLPDINKDLLLYLFSYLNQLQKYSEINKMVPNNIAIVFAPNLFRPKEETPESMMTEMPIATKAISLLIEHYDELFGEEPEEEEDEQVQEE